MYLPLVVFGLCAVVVVVLRVRRALRRRHEPDMHVTTWPDIELSERYGGWNPDAYDAGTGRDQRPVASYRRLADGGMRTATPKPGGPLARRRAE